MNPTLWNPSHNPNSHINKFIEFLSDKYSELQIKDFNSLHKWSVQNYENFWEEFLLFSNFSYTGKINPILEKKDVFQNNIWFPNLQLNFAENILNSRLNLSIEKKMETCIISIKENGETKFISNDELIKNTLKIKSYLKKIGIKKGSKVVACMPNVPETIYLMLAVTSLGACFSSSSPDFGIPAILDRFGQIEPELLLISDCYFYKGKKIPKLFDYLEIPLTIKTIKKTIIYPFTDEIPDISIFPNSILYNDMYSEPEDISTFEKFAFNNPVYIMYSSGTTGLPKCMIQGSGVLLNHVKEHLLHLNLQKNDTLFYFTTCGWMMWNWMVSTLFVGSKLLLFEGNPFFPGPDTLWKIAEEHKISIFGTSAGYLSALQKSGYSPVSHFNLKNLNTILTTGSPLLPDQFDFVYDKVSNNVQLSSISGGTDLNGCFVLGNPLSPVRRGEIQGSGLGMNVQIWNESGKEVFDEEGELVCTAPFPSMPVYFGNDEDGEKYHKAYFEKFPNVWRHGDYGIQTKDGGFIILGRSDATLNPGGVRIGTSDIYRIVEKISGIVDSLAVGINIRGEEKVILFIKIQEGALFQDLEIQLKERLKIEASPKHVPSFVFAISDIPYTRNMKKVELIIKNLLEGKVITNRESLHNPDILEEYSKFKNSIFT
jgi:acetoacetyl-CoA synthetase